eukprot:TRINITY_DN69507_c0_g1_i1.p1 TRINITY_DN69507_c0_g1~~TRINITY_DN69507_c0_g1_i1.p1  ORF type:complete len:332 (-),score=22.23 TRINITY_DN69507_c0_g1_i1:80-976(-)
MEALSAHLGCNIYVMREDLTGFGLGGNKVRKLDFLLGDARQKDTKAVISKKASSFTRNAAVGCKKFDMEAHFVIDGCEEKHNPHSKRFFELHDAHLYYAPAGTDMDNVYTEILAKLQQRVEGKVYEMHPGGSDHIGALGYLRVFQLIAEFTEKTGIHFDFTVHPAGSTGTQVGLIMGQIIANYAVKHIGMSVSQPEPVQVKRVADLCFPTATMLEFDFKEHEDKILIDGSFIGPGYPIPSEESKAAVRLFAQLEGLLLDEIYGGKAAAGLIQYAKTKQFGAGNVLFIHTGGNGGLYYD